MAYYESHYNTTARKVLEDGSIDYGIFQINSFTWCRDKRLSEKNYCHVACSALLMDDLTDAIICAKKIAKETQGMNYWQGWKKHCDGKDLSDWKRGCDVS
uniref:Lysozyme-like 1 n=2 Tax=Jaculus jaculus TaxID=51337 RepID=A0A8C5JZR8_JACJA